MTLSLESLPRRDLLAVAHECMLLGMLSNQATLPQVVLAGGTLDDMNAVAIDLWMGASPVYTQRMRRLMGIEGDDVGAIMKALQLDVGFVHQYMDVRYRLDGPDRGEFWLAHCGALLNVEPHGEDQVFGMCHTIEDPTFDATAYATNPRARIRPVHRPPRQPADREPHCHWTITIDPQEDPVGPARLTQAVGRLPLASVPVAPRPPGDGYQGAFDPDRRLAGWSDATLTELAREFAVQTHLLMCSAELALRDRFDEALARGLTGEAWLAASWVASERLAAALGGGGVADVLALHPAIPPGFARTVRADGPRIELTVVPDSPALGGTEQPGWIGALARGDTRGVEGMARGVDPGARVVATATGSGEHRFTIETGGAAGPEPDSVALMRIGMLHRWAFQL